MEGLAVFGGVAAACTLSVEMIKLGRSLRKMVKSIKYARRDIIGALTSARKYEYSWVETLTAHMKWYLSRASVKYFRASLKVARESIQAYTNIRCIEKLDEQLDMLKKAIENGAEQSLEKELKIKVVERMNTVKQQM
ncbi:hypothetical protein DM02DRAFT_533387 [Periconia macrospinosa]|uniref:Uncharacterized protein n=1 Tax=Periconia macrospinosa TaxID=97972 RepID=A0A2V1DHC2_9PLEO|nr:hypothetical protein DM02DRAFT_533387 [Periconia macrospinosa]